MKFTTTMILLSTISMYWWRKNIIPMLLSLELLLITLLFTLMYNSPTTSLPSLMIMLILMASGSSMGLSLLVSLSRSHNSSNSIFIMLTMYVKIIIPNNYFNIFLK